MFRPIAVINRFSSESMVVVLYRIGMVMSRWWDLNMWYLLYAIVMGHTGVGVSVMCAILGCAAQVCLLAAVLCGSPAVVCPFPDSTCRESVQLFTNLVFYHLRLCSCFLKPTLHFFMQSGHLNWYMQRQSLAEGEPVLSGEVFVPSSFISMSSSYCMSMSSSSSSSSSSLCKSSSSFNFAANVMGINPVTCKLFSVSVTILYNYIRFCRLSMISRCNFLQPRYCWICTNLSSF